MEPEKPGKGTKGAGALLGEKSNIMFKGRKRKNDDTGRGHGLTVYTTLHYGKENAITAKVLARMLNTNKRTVTAHIESERRQGVPICATSQDDPRGYYIAETAEELAEYIDRLKHREKEIAKTRRTLAKITIL